LLEKLMKESTNNSCNDCDVSHPNWASINNGVFLCLNCAGVHRGFGVQVSIIRSLTMDNWDDNQIAFLQKGGNQRFKNLMKEYNVPDNAGPEFKYLISATNYYRKLLRSEVTGEAAPVKPDTIMGLELLDFGNNNYTNITNSQPITSHSVNNSNEKKDEGGFFGKVGGFFAKAVKEIKESNIKEKLIETGDKAFVIAKKAGSFVAEKGKEAYNSQVVQNIAHKTEEGINNLVIKAKKVFVGEQEEMNSQYNPINSNLNKNVYHSEEMKVIEPSNPEVNYHSENKPVLNTIKDKEKDIIHSNNEHKEPIQNAAESVKVEEKPKPDVMYPSFDEKNDTNM